MPCIAVDQDYPQQSVVRDTRVLWEPYEQTPHAGHVEEYGVSSGLATELGSPVLEGQDDRDGASGRDCGVV